MALSFFVWAGQAQAQGSLGSGPSDAEVRDTAALLDTEGTRDMDTGDLAAACPKLAQSYRLDPGVGVLLRLALCDERAGRTATAWTRYREASELAQRGGNGSLRELALRRAAALEPLLPKLTVRVKSVDGLRVTLDGETLARDAWSLPVPVDPGRHEIVAVAPGMRRFVAWVTSLSDPGAREVIDVALEPDARPVERRVAPGGSRSEARATTQPGSNWQRFAAISLGVLGAAGLVTSGIFGASALSSMNTARDQCPNHVGCPPSALALQNDARSAATISTVAFAAGAGAIVGGLALWLTAPHADDHSAWRVEPLVETHTAGIDCTRAF